MSRNFAEHEWDRLQQRSGIRFNRYVHHDYETSECKQMKPLQQHETLYQINEECSEIN
jgi:hypothetical protein